MLRNALRKLWLDPVWSKVIATGIVAIVGIAMAWLISVYSNVASTQRGDKATQPTHQDILVRNLVLGSCGKPRDYRMAVSLISELPSGAIPTFRSSFQQSKV
jgi:hypothetical protein